MGLIAASKGQRAGAYIIDVIPPLIVGFSLAPYWLLRDITGASIGKLLLSLRVVAKDGQEASVGKRILRNLPLAIGPSLLIIPLLGYIIAPTVAFLVSL